MRIGDTVKVLFEATVVKVSPLIVKDSNGYGYSPSNAAKIEVIKRVYSIGDFCEYQGFEHVVAAIVDGYYVLSSPGLKPRLLEV